MMTDMTDHELNIEVAKLAGYRVIPVSDTDASGYFFKLVTPDGGGTLAHTEAEAWSHAPDFAADLNAAYGLPRCGYLLTVVESPFVARDEYQASFATRGFRMREYGGADDAYAAEDEKPARAVCKAWLKLAKAQEVRA